MNKKSFYVGVLSLYHYSYYYYSTARLMLIKREGMAFQHDMDLTEVLAAEQE